MCEAISLFFIGLSGYVEFLAILCVMSIIYKIMKRKEMCSLKAVALFLSLNALIFSEMLFAMMLVHVLKILNQRFF